ncbi:MAG TPA: gamma-glutamylcyclotransferase family protein [Alphaproteobacteria bacterium]|nr:gamma-glutamylcyclotransferase family protein [Alphaproteobacteria bacterium]
MRRVYVFFYGLFMDVDLLGKKGIDARLRPASLGGFRLRIGDRATLIPSEGDTVYGMVAALTHRDIDQLYSDPSLREYRPEAVQVDTDTGETIPALCFNLTEAPQRQERNPEYANKLRDLAGRLGFPSEYVSRIK